MIQKNLYQIFSNKLDSNIMYFYLGKTEEIRKGMIPETLNELEQILKEESSYYNETKNTREVIKAFLAKRKTEMLKDKEVLLDAPSERDMDESEIEDNEGILKYVEEMIYFIVELEKNY